MTWTKKYDEFALACNLSESATYVLRDILRKGKLNDVAEIEIDLRKTNNWIGKYRAKGEYHRKTIVNAIPRLDERTNGMVTIIKRYNPWIYKIMVRPLSFLERIQGAFCASSPKLQTGKPMFDAEHKKRVSEQQQQDISNLDSLFKKIGIKYNYDALNRIWRLAGKSLKRVSNAVELLLYQNSSQTEKIRNPQGWIVSCLTYGWSEDLNLYYDAVKLPFFNSCEAIIDSVRKILPEPPDIAQFAPIE